ncbi:AAA family ATPase [Candidatus Sulfurimonas marisnigri]|uniref:AAA family ATPase n=1 Tax=Candidatus Sulfurimonas marisnigri TaxID=2740405 RepID=A0A7S7LYZ7_9BACT|nr:AAA family ATPase [Candidatus Sulfurimonas marisnigri]QOY54006.1 AAA family ATPase [Candidatus Sulfurimonas marisnigri]
MIDKLHIEAFKCFERESLEFRNLTVLTGTNGSGKSSVIQSLLQLSLHSNRDYASPLLKYLDFISNFDEAVNFNMDVDKYTIAIDGFGGSLKYNFIRESMIEGHKDQGIAENISYSKGNLVFLSADRIGPQDTYDKNNNPLDRFGLNGEYAISFLENARKNKHKVIEDLIQHDGVSREFLDSQVNHWLTHILDTEIVTEEINGTNQVKAKFKNGNEFVRPKNIGSGISYLTSILIACLSANKENIIIIENPEIHMHPKAQSKLGEFLAFVASKGIQIIIETHNDHIINRFRYEVYEGNLKSDEIIIHYKEKDTSFEQIEITENGKFCDKNGENSFPSGFYDATLKEIFKINKGR